MAQQTNDVTTRLNVDPGNTVGALGQIYRTAGNLGKSLGSLTHHLQSLSGFAIVGFAQGINEANKLYDSIGRIKAITGASAQEIDAVVDLFGKVGLAADDAEGVLTKMARKSLAAAGGMSATAEQAEAMAKKFRMMGVDIKAGPEAQMVQLAKAAQSGKLQIDGLVQTFGVPISKASSMLELLQKGPEEVRRLMAEQKGSIASVTDESLAAYKRMMAARNAAANAFQNILTVFYRTVFPIVAKALTEIQTRLEAWAPIAEKVGKVMVDNMSAVVFLAEKYVKLLLISKALNAVTGKGLVDNLKGLGGLVTKGGGGGRVAKALGVAGPLLDTKAGARRIAAVGIAGKLDGGPIGRLQSFFATLASSFFPKVAAVLAGTVKFGAILGMFAKLSIVGAIIGVIVKAIQLLVTNADGVRDRFQRILDTIVAQFRGVTGALTPVIDALGTGLTYAAKGVLGIVEAILTMVAGIMVFVRTIGTFIAMLVESPARLAKPIQTFQDALAIVQQDTAESLRLKELQRAKDRAEASSSGAPAEAKGVYQDFRGSKFEIEQNFTEGYDAGRVATVFGHDIAKLGERRLQSGLAPLYGVR